jgi:hypothetical protein
MRMFKTLRGVVLALCLATCLLVVMMPGQAFAKKPKVLLSEAEQTEVKEILKHVKYESSGIGGKPTVLVSGASVQVVNGEGKTASANGTGNLVIGYDENGGKHEQTGSHDLIVGEEQTFTSYGGILGGFENTISAPAASVTGGDFNVASEAWASVSGGNRNNASGPAGSVSGGYESTAEGAYSSVSGGRSNSATGYVSSVSGGDLNNAGSPYSGILAGKERQTVFEWEGILQ